MLADKPTDAPTDPPKPTHTPKPPNTHVPTHKTSVPTDTFVPTDTNDQALTITSDCVFGLTPTATGVPTCTPTSTPTLTDTETPTTTAYPGVSTSTPRSAKTPSPTHTGVLAMMPTASATSAGADSTTVQGMAGASATASLTPTKKAAPFSWSVPTTGSNPIFNANNMPFLLLFAATMIGGGVFFAYTSRIRRVVSVPATGGGVAATMAINPTAVGAVGFTAWLSRQDPLLNYGEKVVLSKVGNGIGSAIHLVSRISDLKTISEICTQEFLQLTSNPPFLTASRRAGFVGA